jgi:predicted MFS family arabinose efflux permease
MRGWRGVGPVTGWQTVASLCVYAIFAATAFLRADFDLSRILVGVTITATMLGYTLLLFVMGVLVDGYGERPVMVGGLLVLGAGTVGVGIAPSYPALLVVLPVIGGAYAAAVPATNRAVLSVTPPGRRNPAMSFKQVGVTVGSGLGAVPVTWVAATRFGWPGGFFIAAVAAAVVSGAFGYRYRGDGGHGSPGLPDVRGPLARPDYRTLAAAGFFCGGTIFTTTAYVVLYLTESTPITAVLAGTTLALVQLTGSVGRVVGGALVDRLPATDARASALVLCGQSLAGVACLVAVVAVVAVDGPLVAAAGFGALGLFLFGIPATTSLPDSPRLPPVSAPSIYPRPSNASVWRRSRTASTTTSR